MKKNLLLIPFIVSLAACSSNKAPDDSVLSPGIMQPVSGSGASTGSYSWPSDIKSAPMPSSMTK